MRPRFRFGSCKAIQVQFEFSSPKLKAFLPRARIPTARGATPRRYCLTFCEGIGA